MALNVNLPLALNSQNTFKAFFHALNDPNFRSGLPSAPGVSKPVTELITLLNDPMFISKAKHVSENYASYLAGKVAAGNVRDLGADLQAYIKSNFPDATQLLSDYSGVVTKSDVVAEGFAANVTTLVNAGVYANVAAATNVVVAAEAVVFAAVFIV